MMCIDDDGGVFEGLYEVVSHPTRRALLDALSETGSTTVGAVAADLVDETDPERIEVRLHHVHLPKMADYGLIEYDPETKTIETTEATAAAADAMTVVRGSDE